MSAKRLAAAIGFVAAGFTAPAFAEDPSYLVVGAGSWEIFRDAAHAGEFDIAYRPNTTWWIFKPHVGFVGVTDGDYYGYAGLLTDIPLGQHIVLTPSIAIGGYGGHGYWLGSHVEFRSGGDIAWRFSDASRLGLGIYHISNAGISRRNPGSESAIVEYSIPLGKLF